MAGWWGRGRGGGALWVRGEGGLFHAHSVLTGLRIITLIYKICSSKSHHCFCWFFFCCFF